MTTLESANVPVPAPAFFEIQQPVSSVFQERPVIIAGHPLALHTGEITWTPLQRFEARPDSPLND